MYFYIFLLAFIYYYTNLFSNKLKYIKVLYFFINRLYIEHRPKIKFKRQNFFPFEKEYIFFSVLHSFKFKIALNLMGGLL